MPQRAGDGGRLVASRPLPLRAGAPPPSAPEPGVVADTYITLQWSPPPGVEASRITGYAVRYRPLNEHGIPTGPVRVAATSSVPRSGDQGRMWQGLTHPPPLPPVAARRCRRGVHVHAVAARAGPGLPRGRCRRHASRGGPVLTASSRAHRGLCTRRAEADAPPGGSRARTSRNGRPVGLGVRGWRRQGPRPRPNARGDGGRACAQGALRPTVLCTTRRGRHL